MSFFTKLLICKDLLSSIYFLRDFVFWGPQNSHWFILVEAGPCLFTYPHGLHFFYPSAKWFVSDIRLPNTACGELHFPVLPFLILWFIKSLALPRDSNISGSD